MGPGPGPQGPVSLGNDYEEMVREANMTVAQKKTVDSIAAEDQKALTKFDQEHAKQLDDINKKLLDARRKQDDLNKLTIDANTARLAYQKQIDALQKQIDLIAAARARLSHSFKVRAMGLFTPAQKAKWVGFKLNRIMQDEFIAVSLSAEQQAKMQDICAQDGQTAIKADVSTDKELLDTAKQQVLTNILDDAQRQKYVQDLQDRQNKAAGIQPGPA